jgi:hypothetical protein
LALHAHVQNNSSSSHGRLLRHQQSMPQQQMAELYRQTFCCNVPQCQRSGLGLSSSVKALAVAVVGLLLRGLLWLGLLMVRLVLLPFAAMAVLAQQHMGLWWALLLHSCWVLGKRLCVNCSMMRFYRLVVCMCHVCSMQQHVGLWWALLLHSGWVLSERSFGKLQSNTN